MTGMMGEEDLNKLEAAQGTEAAKLFLTQMIAHHEGAVMMAKTETTEARTLRRSSSARTSSAPRKPKSRK